MKTGTTLSTSPVFGILPCFDLASCLGRSLRRFAAGAILAPAIAISILAQAPPVYTAPTPPVQAPPPSGPAQPAASAATAAPVPPPAAPAKLSQVDLEKLLMPIALYPDPLLATILPASVYPLEIVQAARFLENTNNLTKLDQQPWDESVKAVARIPAALKKLNDDLPWTIQLGEAFLNQDKDVMDMIQLLRSKAQKAGTLQTTEQQIIVVTNMVVEKTVEQQVIVVTNTVVQIQPSNPQVVYVPSYPYSVYYPPPAYVYNPYAPLVTFAAGVTMGAIIANNCDWHHGGCYWGGGDVNIDIDRNFNYQGGDRTSIRGGNTANNTAAGKKWQPDQNRVRTSGSAGSVKSMESRGWSGGASPSSRPSSSARPSTQPSVGSRPGGQPSAAARPSTPSAAARPSAGPSAAARPAGTTQARPSATPGATPSAGAANRSAGASPAARPSPSVSSSPNRSGGSAFSGGGASQRSYSQRGSASRGGGGFSRGGGGRGGGGRR